MKNSRLYGFIRVILKFFTKCFLTPKMKGLENIPKEGRIILAGNHTNILDCCLLMSSTKRQVHFLAKKELFEGTFGFFFKKMDLIPVDRTNHTTDAFEQAIKYLNNDEVIGIFPEGTFPKNGEVLLPFHSGAIRMAKETNSKIVPFVIKGKYRLWARHQEITFLEPITIKSNDIEKETDKLRNIILTNKEK